MNIKKPNSVNNTKYTNKPKNKKQIAKYYKFVAND